MMMEIRQVGERWVLFIGGMPAASSRNKDTVLRRWPEVPVRGED